MVDEFGLTLSSLNAEERVRVERAHQLCDTNAGDDTRQIFHARHVAVRVSNPPGDGTTMIAALLLDAFSAIKNTTPPLATLIGDDAVLLLERMTQLQQYVYRGVGKVETWQKLFLKVAGDMRALFLFFEHRLDTLKGRHHQCREFDQCTILAREAKDIFAPLAEQLGMTSLARELEDVSFALLSPTEYEWVNNLRSTVIPHEWSEDYLRLFVTILTLRFQSARMPFVDIITAMKPLYTLWQDLQRVERDITRIYDILTVEIVEKTIADCYTLLGFLHECYQPFKGRIRDYIAQPEKGMTGLRTTLFAERGQIVEIYIHTKEAREEAPLPELPSATSLFIFTPSGEPIELPEGATAVDFAYAIHNDIGNQCVGARVNGKNVPISTALAMEDTVEIMVDKKRSGPSREWLAFVVSKHAKEAIKHALSS